MPRYWSGYQWYHDIRTTLGKRCTAECRVAQRAVNHQTRQALFVAAERDSCDLAFRGVVVVVVSGHVPDNPGTALLAVIRRLQSQSRMLAPDTPVCVPVPRQFH